jgi:hypothetical protein
MNVASIGSNSMGKKKKKYFLFHFYLKFFFLSDFIPCGYSCYIGERVQKLGLVINLSFFYFTISKIITKIESSLLSY